MSEKVTRSERPLSKAQERDREKNPWRYPLYDFRPSGQLRLHIVNAPYAAGFRKSWSDGKRQRLEECLANFLRGLETVSAGLKVQREERECQRQKAEEERRRREAEASRAWQEERRAKVVESRLERWRTALEIRAFVDVLRTATTRDDEGAARQEESRRWVEWAEMYSKQLEVSAVQFPPFVGEPSTQDRVKWGIW